MKNLYYTMIKELYRLGWKKTPEKGTYCSYRDKGDKYLVSSLNLHKEINNLYIQPIINFDKISDVPTNLCLIVLSGDSLGNKSEIYRIDFNNNKWHLHKSPNLKKHITLINNGLNNDISEWKKVIQAISQYRESFPSLIDQKPDGFFKMIIFSDLNN